MSEFHELTKKLIEFRRERGWEGHNDPKDFAISTVVEAGELLELFLWRDGEDYEKYLQENKEKISDEMSDVLSGILMLADRLDIDVPKAWEAKLEKTKKKYPVDKVKGRVIKWTEL